ncbi:MAG: bifunctional riboflavin kinase/FAD synthetase [Proteobacteria bacterium]|nr:bifunctional riboflavin kinase/FAD synthetase [Pseudomonadota bacterium]
MAQGVFIGSSTFPDPSPGPVVTIGNFDGVHRGHQALVEQTMVMARAKNRPSCIYTFDPAPRDVLRPNNDIPRIQSLERKIETLFQLGVEMVVVEPFDREFGQREAKWFAQEVLHNRLGVSGLVLGWDFKFGRRRGGSARQVREWIDVDVEEFPPFFFDGEVVSSSRIRMAVRDGGVGDAARLLTRPHEVCGPVVAGDGRGRTIGFPTANVDSQKQLLPAPGVYAVRVDVGGSLLAGVANIGVRPTFGPGRVPLEVHLLHESIDLYGQQLRVLFVERIRSEKKFESKDHLANQIARDVRQAAELLGSAR